MIVGTYEVGDVVAAMTEVVASKPTDFRYCKSAQDTCFYRPVSEEKAALMKMATDDPRRTCGCIVGETVKVLDPRLYGLLIEDRAITNQPMEVFNRFTYDAMEVLYAAQRRQDQGHTWPEALAFAQSERRGEI